MSIICIAQVILVKVIIITWGVTSFMYILNIIIIVNKIIIDDIIVIVLMILLIDITNLPWFDCSDPAGFSECYENYDK